MRVALFKRLPVWSSIAVHPIWRILRRSEAVSAIRLYLSRDRRLDALPPVLGAPARAVDSWLLRAATWRRAEIASYGRMKSPEILDQLGRGAFDIVIPDGYTLVNRPILDSARIGVLLFHYGALPSMRGMNTVEWCLLLGRAPACTLYFYDEGIDTGDILAVETIEEPYASIAEARRRAAAASWRLMARFFADPQPLIAARRSQQWHEGRTFYKMTPELREIAEYRASGDSGRLVRATGGIEARIARLRAGAAALSPEPDRSTLPETLLQRLRTPRQDRDAAPADRLVTALHFLHRREETDPQTIDAVGARVRGVAAEAGLWPPEQILRLANELILLDDAGHPLASLPEVPDLLATAAATATDRHAGAGHP